MELLRESDERVVRFASGCEESLGRSLLLGAGAEIFECLVNQCVAFANGSLQPFSIDDLDRAASDPNATGVFQLSEDRR